MLRKLAYISIVASLLGANLISVGIAGFRLSLFRIVVIVILITVIAFAFLKNGNVRLPECIIKSYSVQFMMIWLFYAVCSVLWVKDDMSWLTAVFFIATGVICVVLFSSVFRSLKDFKPVILVFAFMLVFHVLVAIFEQITGIYPLTSDQNNKFIRLGLPLTTFRNTNDFATFITLVVFILYTAVAISGKKIVKVLGSLVALCCVWLVLVTDSRANIIGLILGTSFLLFTSIPNNKAKKYVISVLSFLWVIIIFSTDVIEKISIIVISIVKFEFSSGSSSDSIRINLLKNGLEFMIKTWGLGTGAGNVEYWVANEAIYDTGSIMNMHNWWMEIFTGFGILIFVLYLLFFMKMFADFYLVQRDSKRSDERIIARGFLCFMAAFIISSISSSTLINVEWLWVFWAVAIAFQFNVIERGKRDEDPSHQLIL